MLITMSSGTFVRNGDYTLGENGANIEKTQSSRLSVLWQVELDAWRRPKELLQKGRTSEDQDVRGDMLSPV